MRCEEAMEIFSADLDGEASLSEVAAAMGHASTCLACRTNRRDMASLHRMVHEYPTPVAPDFAATAVAESRRSIRIRRGVARFALACISVLLFTYVVPEILATHGDAHLEHHLAVWGLTFAVAIFFIALKPALSRVVRPIATLFAASMLLIAVIDIIRGETPMLAETHHLLEVAAVGLIWVISLPAKAPPADEGFMGLSIVADDDGEQTAAG